MIEPCQQVKDDLKAGTFSNYTGSLPIYILDQDDFQGGSNHLRLSRGKRDPIVAANGKTIFVNAQCTIEIRASSIDNRNNIYDDIISILESASLGYVPTNESNTPDSKNLLRKSFGIKFIVMS
jgi:hypothetical protein